MCDRTSRSGTTKPKPPYFLQASRTCVLRLVPQTEHSRAPAERGCVRQHQPQQRGETLDNRNPRSLTRLRAATGSADGTPAVASPAVVVLWRGKLWRGEQSRSGGARLCAIAPAAARRNLGQQESQIVNKATRCDWFRRRNNRRRCTMARQATARRAVALRATSPLCRAGAVSQSDRL